MRTLLLIGDARSAEAAQACAELLDIGQGWRVVRYESIEAACTCVPAVDVILVLQTRPREFSVSEIGRLYHAFPLARLVVGLGVWCGSAHRREGVWPESAVEPIGNVTARLRREFDEIDAGVAGLPITAGRDERASRISASVMLPAEMLVQISSPDRALRDWLADLIRGAGGVPDLDSDVVAVDGVVWDVDPWENVVRPPASASGPIIALAGLPTVSLSRQLRAVGATAVVGKPCDADVLLRALGGAG